MRASVRIWAKSRLSMREGGGSKSVTGNQGGSTEEVKLTETGGKQGGHDARRTLPWMAAAERGVRGLSPRLARAEPEVGND